MCVGCECGRYGVVYMHTWCIGGGIAYLYSLSLDWLLGQLVLAKQVIKLFINLPVALLSVWSHQKILQKMLTNMQTFP